MAIAALLTKPCIGIFISCKAFLVASQSDKSTHIGVTLGVSATSESKCFFVLDTAITFAPHSTNFLTIPLPMPAGEKYEDF